MAHEVRIKVFRNSEWPLIGTKLAMVDHSIRIKNFISILLVNPNQGH